MDVAAAVLETGIVTQLRDKWMNWRDIRSLVICKLLNAFYKKET